LVRRCSATCRALASSLNTTNGSPAWGTPPRPSISMGMDGLNNAVIPGHATPEQYVKEITVANDGIVNQKTVMAYAQESFNMINQLDRWGVKFEKDETGDYAVKKVHHIATYVLPMPEGHHMKKVLYRQLKKARVEITNRGAEYREHHAFCKQLSEHAPARGAEHCPHGDLTASRRAVGEQEVGDVGAGDEQQDSGRR